MGVGRAGVSKQLPGRSVFPEQVPEEPRLLLDSSRLGKEKAMADLVIKIILKGFDLPGGTSVPRDSGDGRGEGEMTEKSTAGADANSGSGPRDDGDSSQPRG